MDITCQVVIRPMNVEDIPRVQKVEARCFPVPWSYAAFRSEVADNYNAYYLVAELDNEIIAYAGIWVIIDEGHITNIAVDPSYQGCGLGRKLMDEITVYAISRGVTRMTLEVRVTNHIAQNLYKKLGYEVYGVRKGYYQAENEDAFIMWKELKEHVNQINIGHRD